MDPRYLYHCFPRNCDQVLMEEKGLKILSSMINSGFLLAPEIIEWKVPLNRDSAVLSSPWRKPGSRLQGKLDTGLRRYDGTKKSGVSEGKSMSTAESGLNDGLAIPVRTAQKRISFTELARSELPKHMETFGSFALEFDIKNLRSLGAIPVFYLPQNHDNPADLSGVAAVMVGKLADVQKYIEKNTAEPQLLNVLKFMSGFFYPTEDMQYTDELAYYRQREWRIVANIVWKGQPVCSIPNQQEINTLVNIDPHFFGDKIQFPNDSKYYSRVEKSKFFTKFGGRHVLSWANKLIVPANVLTRVRNLLEQKEFSLQVESLS